MPNRLKSFSACAAFIVLLALGACGGGASTDANSRVIACGPVEHQPDQNCTLEVEDRQGTLHLTLRQPEGGFRRLIWPKGKALQAADGAEPLDTLPIKGGGVEAHIGGWSYRIEAKGGGLP